MCKISVIVTTYNRKNWVQECIESILNQSYRDFEVIVVDNYSDYNFEDLKQNFRDERIRWYQNENGGIIAVNRNFGIKKSNGKYIAFCDDDDVWIETKLERQIEVMEKDQLDLVSSDLVLFKDDINKPIGVQKSRPLKDINSLLKNNEINTSSVLVKNSDLVFFPENKYLIGCEDYALWLKLYNKNYKFKIINEAHVYYRLSNNFSNNNRYNKHLKIIIILLLMKLENNEIGILRYSFKNFLYFYTKQLLLRLKLY